MTNGTAPASVPDTQLGLSAAEISILRTQSNVAFQSPGQGGRSNASSSRGRGTSRTSASVSSSRAASAASSHTQTPGRLLLDPGSLNVLTAHFDRLMQRIQDRVDELTEQTESSALAASGGAAQSVAEADRELARLRECMRQIDELEAEFEKCKRIRDVVKTLRTRVDTVKSRMR